MGKIRIKTLGDEKQEKQEKNEAVRKAQGKQQRKEAQKTAKAPGLKGGQRVVTVGPGEEEIQNVIVTLSESKGKQSPDSGQARMTSEGITAAPSEHIGDKKVKKVKKATKARERSKKYKAVAHLVERTKTYPLTDALETLPKIKLSNFDETVELHITAIEKGINGTITLPHGTGKERKIAIADDNLIKDIEKGKITFDVLLATPEMMPKLAKVARVLGPKGLMPNPKNGTITTNPNETIKKFQGGLLNYKTESKSPIIHLSVGKLSFGIKKLEDNIQTVLSSLPSAKIKKIILKSTMSPGIKINLLPA